jgi:hypoxanthine phosphoribosyltransferase
MKKTIISNEDVRNFTLEIIRQMNVDVFVPEVVIGFARGGLIPANFISQWYGIPMYCLNKDEEYNFEFLQHKKILVIDDINDTGNTLYNFNVNYKKDLKFKYAALIENSTSMFQTDYAGLFINKNEDPHWIVFPWEIWWH